MEDVVLRELETLAKERKQDVTSIIANAVKIGIEKIRQDTAAGKLNRKIAVKHLEILEKTFVKGAEYNV